MTTSSIGFSLGIGSGIDIAKLVTDLSNASKAPKEALLKKREDLNTARISSLGEISGAIDSFASALSSLIAGGSLFTQPSVSDTSVFTASAVAGARLGSLSASVEVAQLAQAQTASSSPLASRTDPVGQGTLTINVGGTNFDVVIDSTNDNLDGLARAINASGSGVTASIVTDAGTARLVIKGQTGEAKAFTIAAAPGATSGLERFAFGPSVTGGMTQAQAAQDAILRIDGVEVRRGTNSFNDVIDGVQIDLKRAVPGTTVALGITRPTAAISQGVNDFVAAYNELMGMIAEATRAGVDGAGGPLRGDLGISEMRRQLSSLPTMVLTSDGPGPHTLAEIGVRTNRDGTLGVDMLKLQTVLAENPDGVEALFNPSQRSSSPFLDIRSLPGKVKPGTYTITNVVPGDPATGFINGIALTSSGPDLIGGASTDAVGLILGVSGPVTSATITIDPGLGGALQSIRDALRARTGPIAGSQERLSEEAEQIADDRDALEMRSQAYYNQLLNNFVAMERQVSSFKATQAYLDQQIKVWSNSKD